MELNTVSTMIVDDDPEAIELLYRLLQVDPRIRIVGTELSSIRALQRLKSRAVDLLFLDVDMPEISGIELAKSLHPKPKIIFTTGYPEFAMDAYDMGLPDCIPKPIRLERLSKSLHRVLGDLWSPDPPKVYTDCLLAKEVKTAYYVKIPFKDIRYIESDKNTVLVNTPGKRFHIRMTYKGLRARLRQQDFIQIHRGFTVAKAAITHFSAKDQTVFLRDLDESLPVSRTYLKSVHDWFKNPGS